MRGKIGLPIDSHRVKSSRFYSTCVNTAHVWHTTLIYTIYTRHTHLRQTQMYHMCGKDVYLYVTYVLLIHHRCVLYINHTCVPLIDHRCELLINHIRATYTSQMRATYTPHVMYNTSVASQMCTTYKSHMCATCTSQMRAIYTAHVWHTTCGGACSRAALP